MGKLEVDKYDGTSNFCVWSTKMRALLSHHDLATPEDQH